MQVEEVIFTHQLSPLRSSGDDNAGVIDGKSSKLAVTPPDAQCAETLVSFNYNPSCGIEEPVATRM